MPSWDPAALLHPTRGTQGATKADIPSSHSHLPSAIPSTHDNQRPVTFEFTSANGKNLDTTTETSSKASSVDDLRCVTDEASLNGVGNWIERMNNVHHRSAVPQAKRRKTEDGQDFSSKANANPVRSGGGFLSDYLKEKQEENKVLHPNSEATVDLTSTATNENEATIIRDPNNEEVCYGMVKSGLNCSIVPAPKPGTRSLWGPSYQPAIKIMLRRQINEKSLKIQAFDHTREIIGVVEPASAAAFCPLLDTNLGLRTDCRIPHHQKKLGEEPGQPISRSYTLDVVWYGPRKHGRAVGKLLQKHNLKLITPYIVQNGIKVDNPHTAELWPTQPKSSSRAVTGSISTVANRTVEEIRSEVMGVFDSLKSNDELPTMDPDSCITTPLLKYQKQGLCFMAMRERSLREHSREEGMVTFWRLKMNARGERIYSNAITGQEQRTCPPESRGGILADVMGLGKTLSILSLVASTREAAQQWRIREPVQRPSLNSRLRKGHESAMQEQQQPRLEPAPVIRQVKATLVICPLSTISNWEEQIKQHTSDGSLTYYVYHGSGRIKDMARLGAFDIVLTTYGSVSNELSARRKGKDGLFPLEEISWFRVVLDEAHMIREQSTLQFKAVCRLQAERRWAVTGTPVQNRLDDLAALLAFLRLHPFDERAKFVRYIVEPFKACDPEIVPKLRVLVDTITLRRLKDKIDLPPREDIIVRLDFSAEEELIYNLFAQNAKDRVAVLAGSDTNKVLGGNTYIHILKAILRLRLLCAHGKDLLNDEDLGVLQGMSADLAIDVDEDEDGDKAALSHQKAHDMFSLMQETNNDACIECQRRLTSADGQNVDMETPGEILGYMTPCFHVLCRICVKDHQDRAAAMLQPGQRRGPCPVCNAVIRPNYVALRRTDVDAEHKGPVKSKKRGSKKHLDKYDGPHTKTKALIEDLLKSQEASKADPTEPPYKSVVFSGWTSHLDLIEVAMKDAQISFRRLDGTMSRTARTAAMDSFREDASVEVILVSIMAGGLGLNLTAANNVYVMEPQYNPAAEAQAVDRVHRLGQKRPVRSVRYIMRGSFEEKMLKLQEKKVKLASLSMDGQSKGLDKAEAARQKLMDLRSLFK